MDYFAGLDVSVKETSDLHYIAVGNSFHVVGLDQRGAIVAAPEVVASPGGNTAGEHSVLA